jgi:hypothetical protein
MDTWQAAVEFLMVDGRAQVLARGHPLTADGRCGRCGSDCTAARLATDAVAMLATRGSHPNIPEPRKPQPLGGPR